MYVCMYVCMYVHEFEYAIHGQSVLYTLYMYVNVHLYVYMCISHRYMYICKYSMYIHGLPNALYMSILSFGVC